MKFFALIAAAVMVVSAHDPGAAWCLKENKRVYDNMDMNNDSFVTVNEAWTWFLYRRILPNMEEARKRCNSPKYPNGYSGCLKPTNAKLQKVKAAYKQKFGMLFKKFAGADGKASWAEYGPVAIRACRNGGI